MHVQQLYTNCLSEAAYFIESNGEAAIIDPLRDVDTYVQLAAERGVQIKYIFETHFHADFVSGHLELSAQTGAPIVFGPGAHADYPIYMAQDGEKFTIGAVTLQAIHTPGHTLESTSYLLYDEAQKPYCIFTGDTLFVGDVGRPDLFSGNLSKEQLAALLYKTLQEKIKPLADDVILYPAHGPGSACGKNLGKETASTIGTEKKTNYALQDMTEAEFVQIVTDGLDAPPAYFLENARINQQGYPPLADVLQKALFPLSVADFKQKKKEGAWIVDTRPATLFTQSFVPDSISIGLEGRFAEWAGSLLPLSQPLLLVTEEGREAESATRLARVGIDQVQGYLKGGLAAWMAAGEPIDMVIDIEADELAMDIPHDDRLEVIDVRKKTEFAAGHIAGAVSIPLDTLADPHTFDMIDTTANLYLHCAGGYRSVIAASLLKRAGFHNLRNILGGYGKIKTCPDIQLLVPHKA